jgi:hypothetical protein
MDINYCNHQDLTNALPTAAAARPHSIFVQDPQLLHTTEHGDIRTIHSCRGKSGAYTCFLEHFTLLQSPFNERSTDRWLEWYSAQDFPDFAFAPESDGGMPVVVTGRDGSTLIERNAVYVIEHKHFGLEAPLNRIDFIHGSYRVHPFEPDHIEDSDEQWPLLEAFTVPAVRLMVQPPGPAGWCNRWDPKSVLPYQLVSTEGRCAKAISSFQSFYRNVHVPRRNERRASARKRKICASQLFPKLDGTDYINKPAWDEFLLLVEHRLDSSTHLGAEQRIV